MASSSPSSLPSWKSDLISIALGSSILTFGTFTLKSGRVSPYFVNCGLFSKARLIRALSGAYARRLHEHALANPSFQFDVLFGPAYKGIPLAATTVEKLAGLDEAKYGEAGYSFNRKEAKDHGEGGTMVGESLRGKRVVIIDDVMTAGTAIREAIQIIAAQGGTLVGIIVAIDRQEKIPGLSEREGKGDDGSARGSTIDEVAKETGVPVMAVLTLGDLIAGLNGLGRHDEVKAMEAYRKQYGASDS